MQASGHRCGEPTQLRFVSGLCFSAIGACVPAIAVDEPGAHAPVDENEIQNS